MTNIGSRNGTRIYVKPRRGDDSGVVIMQGKSYVVVHAEELPQLIEAMHAAVAESQPA